MNSIRVIIRLFSEGSIEISTPEKGYGEVNSEAPCDLLVHTLIQPDADVITYVSRRALAHPEILSQHFKKIEQHIRSIRVFRQLLARTWILFPLLLASGIYKFGIQRIQWVGVSLVFSAIPLIIKPFFRYYLKFRIGKEIQRICRG